MKKFFFLALMAFLWLPATTWANDANEEFDDNEQEDYDNGSITSSSISLNYKILTVATSEEQSGAGTVELEGVATESANANLAALSIPHIIVHVELDETYNAHTYYYTVTGIASTAFANNTTLTSITIPYTVTYIADSYSSGAFYGCTGLTSVTFAENSSNSSQLTTIGLNAFRDCSRLTSIDLPASVTTLGANCFYNCSSLTEVKLPESIPSIPSDCFYGCSNLTTVWMSGSVTIYTRAFAECQSLSAFVLEGSSPSTSGGTESGTNPFNDDAGDVITLYVPTGSAPAYLKTNWVNDINNDDETLQWNFNSISILSDSNDEDGTYYATYCTDAAGEFGSDITANMITNVSTDGTITLSSISNATIPAETGLLLSTSNYSGLNSGVTYYYHPYELNTTTADVSSNMLYGSSTSSVTTTGPEEGVEYYFYMLSLDAESSDGSIGFYWGDTYGEGGAFTSAAGKAYLAVPISTFDSTTPAYLSFKKDESDTTGISSVESASEKTVSGIYTIQGVRVSNMNQPGLYIVDGKKVLVK